MKKVVTPENFMLVQMVLTSFSSVCIAYNLRTFIIIILSVQTLLVGFCMGFLWWQSNKEFRALKESIQPKT